MFMSYGRTVQKATNVEGQYRKLPIYHIYICESIGESLIHGCIHDHRICQCITLKRYAPEITGDRETESKQRPIISEFCGKRIKFFGPAHC